MKGNESTEKQRGRAPGRQATWRHGCVRVAYPRLVRRYACSSGRPDRDSPGLPRETSFHNSSAIPPFAPRDLFASFFSSLTFNGQLGGGRRMEGLFEVCRPGLAGLGCRPGLCTEGHRLAWNAPASGSLGPGGGAAGAIRPGLLQGKVGGGQKRAGDSNAPAPRPRKFYHNLA